MTEPAPVDSLGFREATAGLPEQVDAAAKVGRTVPLPDDAAVSHVVVVGVGANTMAGEVVKEFARPEMAVPTVVLSSGDVPAFVGPGSLVFAVSWSGADDSTVDAAEIAADRGAAVVAVTGDGRLASVAQGSGWPVIPVPTSLPQARAALGALCVPMLVVLERMGLLSDVAGPVRDTIEQLVRRRDELTVAENLADRVARRIGRTFPMVHGSPGLTGVAAHRWKAQINANAKTPAFWSTFPELVHDELAGWGQSGDVTRQLLTVVSLRHRAEPAALARRIDVVSEMLQEVVGDVVAVWAEGRGSLAQFFDLVLVGDFVSLSLAGREGVDPGPVPVLDDVERLLAP